MPPGCGHKKNLGVITMIRKVIFAILALLFVSVVIVAQESKPAAKYYDFDGKRYMAFPAFTSQGLVDPSGKGVKVPMFVQLEQHGKTLYGCIYLPEPPTDDVLFPEVKLHKVYIESGIVAKKSAKFTVSSSYISEDNSIGTINIVNGKTYLTFTLIETGPKLKLDLLELDPDDKLSGIYLGLMAPGNAPPGQRFNLGLGVYNNKGKITGASIYAYPSGGAGFRSGLGTYDSKTGKMNLKDPDQELSASGTFAKEQINFHSDSYDDPIIGKLFRFGHVISGKPKLKKPNPRKLKSGDSTEVVFKSNRVSPGMRVRITNTGSDSRANPLIYIKKYSFENNILKVYFHIEEKFDDKFTLDVINPDGNKTSSKKMLMK